VRTREAVNNAMAGLRYDEMVGDAGKDRLKSAIRDAVNAALPQAPVEQVYIRELLVQ
jgi:flagellar basal body-associated protein FliL